MEITNPENTESIQLSTSLFEKSLFDPPENYSDLSLPYAPIYVPQIDDDNEIAEDTLNLNISCFSGSNMDLFEKRQH